MKSTSFRLPEEVLAALEKLATANRRTKTNMLTVLILEAAEKPKEKK